MYYVANLLRILMLYLKHSIILCIYFSQIIECLYTKQCLAKIQHKQPKASTVLQGKIHQTSNTIGNTGLTYVSIQCTSQTVFCSQSEPSKASARRSNGTKDMTKRRGQHSLFGNTQYISFNIEQCSVFYISSFQYIMSEHYQFSLIPQFPGPGQKSVFSS